MGKVRPLECKNVRERCEEFRLSHKTDRARSAAIEQVCSWKRKVFTRKARCKEKFTRVLLLVGPSPIPRPRERSPHIVDKRLARTKSSASDKQRSVGDRKRSVENVSRVIIIIIVIVLGLFPCYHGLHGFSEIPLLTGDVDRRILAC